MNDINFRANHIKNVNILKQSATKYKPHKISLVEMDLNSRKDINSIKATSEFWDNSFTVITYEQMNSIYNKHKSPKGFHVYALTTQKTNFKKIKPSCILGVLEFLEDTSSGNKIEVLQTNPSYIKSDKNILPKFKHIGQELVNYIINKYPDKDIYLNPSKLSVGFYKKLGFDWDPQYKYQNRLFYGSKKHDC